MYIYIIYIYIHVYIYRVSKKNDNRCKNLNISATNENIYAKFYTFLDNSILNRNPKFCTNPSTVAKVIHFFPRQPPIFTKISTHSTSIGTKT